MPFIKIKACLLAPYSLAMVKNYAQRENDLVLKRDGDPIHLG
ncbi:Uncharacterised protein [Salmonella enterica subsp. arizonae]|uniref:Uncharacterized protein n=1 Tax=Salmonella enterica subsp. arizonae TaxID=59203 RepID=A0A2X4VZT9_SALER|nr:Uncharacterised protein [Salmonella enterica subsp. arizonae]SUF20645.1 Uncharacterised protein [Salmonella enterica]SUF54531.1 Uncharacterised protein [Salmonella enterica]SUG36412.1 Uncharacterised protein [Salmonella enterica subsp. arizonae]SUG45493.1 Uncharacterised protein [Salmonella enterica subsp. arizonae]